VDYVGLILIAAFVLVIGATLWATPVFNDYEDEDSGDERLSDQEAEDESENQSFTPPQQRSLSSSGASVGLSHQGLRKFGGGGGGPCPDTNISIPQAPVNTDWPAGSNLVFKVQNSVGDDFLDDNISAALVGGTYNLLLANYKVSIAYFGGNNNVNKYRNIPPAVNLKDSVGTFIPAPTVNDLGIGVGGIDVLLADIDVFVNGVSVHALLLQYSTIRFRLEDSQSAFVTAVIVALGNTVTATIPDVALTLQGDGAPISFGAYVPSAAPNVEVVDSSDAPVAITKISNTKVEVAGGGGGIAVSVVADNLTPDIEELVTFTITAAGADRFCIFTGDTDGVSRLVNSLPYRYHIGGTYTIDAFAANTGAGTTGSEIKPDYITVNGFAEAYSGYVYGPTLLRITAAQTNCVRLYRAASATYQDVGFGNDGWIDVDAVETFANGSQVKINKVYHPTITARDCVQATPANMPPLTDGSGVIYRNSANKPEWRCSGSEFWTIPNFDYFPAGDTNLALQFIGNADNNANSKIVIAHYDSSTNQRGFFFYLRNGVDWSGVWSSTGTSVQVNTCGAYIDQLEAFQIQLKMGDSLGNRLAGYRNGVAQSTATVSGNENGHIFEPNVQILIMGSYSGGSPGGSYQGGCSAAMIFNEDKTADQPEMADNLIEVAGLND